MDIIFANADGRLDNLGVMSIDDLSTPTFSTQHPQCSIIRANLAMFFSTESQPRGHFLVPFQPKCLLVVYRHHK